MQGGMMEPSNQRDRSGKGLSWRALQTRCGLGVRGRRFGVGLSTLALFAVLLPLLAWADNENRVLIDRVEFDPKEMTLTLHADILDVKGIPVENVQPQDIEILAGGKPLKFTEGGLTLQTAEKAQEPVAIVLLLNESRAYQVNSESEKHSTFDQEKEGAAQFIQRLSGNDMVAVLVYREGTPHEVLYSFAGDFKQAREAVMNAVVPQAEELPANNQGEQKAPQSLLPESVRAVDKALSYFVDNLDKSDKIKTARRRFLVVMSDGKDRETRKDKLTAKTSKMLEKYQDYKIHVHTIGYSQDDEQYLSNLQTIANTTGGVYSFINNKDGLGFIPSVWDNISGRIKKQYVITAKLSDLPDWGERIQGKDEANYAIALKVKMKDGATAEAGYNDVHLPLPSVNWTKYLKLAGMVLGGILGVGLIIAFIVFMAKRKPAQAAESGKREKVEYDGPSRGKLTVLQGPLAGEIFPLIDDVTTIGSMKGNTIIIQDGSVSRRHAAIKIDQMRYEVADMNSTNGVLVNGQKIHKIFLRDGDRIQIGSTEIVFSLK
jgi:hypothetical protein